MTDLSNLIEKLQAATGPDRELDCEIAVALDGYFEVPPRFGRVAVDYACTRGGETMLPGQGGDQLVPHYTASLDAVVELAERLFGHAATLDITINIGAAYHSCAFFPFELDEPFVAENARTPAIAACIAILKAKEFLDE